MRSMTGFGRSEVERGKFRVAAEIRALNQRFFELKLNLPRTWGEMFGSLLHSPELIPHQTALVIGDILASSPRAAGEILAFISELKRNPIVRGAATGAGQAARGAGLATIPRLGGQQQEQPQQ